MALYVWALLLAQFFTNTLNNYHPSDFHFFLFIEAIYGP